MTYLFLNPLSKHIVWSLSELIKYKTTKEHTSQYGSNCIKAPLCRWKFTKKYHECTMCRWYNHSLMSLPYSLYGINRNP